MLLNLINKKEKQVKEFNMGDKIGYALGDVGCGTFFQFVTTYLMVFYTDVLGISAAAVGTLFIVARIWDAINDPIMGVIVDKTGTSEYGKFRPYLIRFGIPMLLVGILVFTKIPGLPENMKLPYAYITYILFGMLYTAVNIPYGSLSSVMTRNPEERTALSTFRSIGGMISGIIVMLFVPGLIYKDNVATANGFLKCAILFAIICSICFVYTFRLTRERIVTEKNSENKSNVKNSLKTLLKNRAFVGISLSSFAMCASMFITIGLNAYLFKEYFKNTNLIAVSGMASMLPALIVLPFIGKLVKKFGKKEVACAGTLLSALVYGFLFISPITNPYVYIGFTMTAGIGNGIVSALTWALIADAIDYQEYISGERNEGTVYSTYSLFRKLSQAISGGIGGFALGLLGYEAGAVQQAESVGVGIKNIICGTNFVGLTISLLSLMFIFNLSKKKVEEVNETLNNRKVNVV